MSPITFLRYLYIPEKTAIRESPEFISKNTHAPVGLGKGSTHLMPPRDSSKHRTSNLDKPIATRPTYLPLPGGLATPHVAMLGSLRLAKPKEILTTLSIHRRWVTVTQ